MLTKKDINIIVIHCSDTDDKQNLDARDIHRMHLSFGWDGIGYHKLIYLTVKSYQVFLML